MTFDPQIKSILEEFHSILLAKSHLEKLRTEVDKEKEKMISINRLIHRSKEKIAEIEQPTELKYFLKSVFYRTSKSLEIEKEKYYDLIMNYQSSQKFIDTAAFDLEVLGKKVLKYPRLRDLLLTKLKERKEQLTKIDNPKLQSILKLFEQLDYKIGLHKEIEEAVEVGETLISFMTKSLSYLAKKSADLKQNQRDSQVITIYNFSLAELEEFQLLSMEVKKNLLKYESEMSDIYSHLNLDLTFSNNKGDSFAADFFESIKTDYSLNSNLEISMSFIENSMKKIEHKQKLFKIDLNHTAKQIKTLEAKIKQELIGFQ